MEQILRGGQPRAAISQDWRTKRGVEKIKKHVEAGHTIRWRRERERHDAFLKIPHFHCWRERGRVSGDESSEDACDEDSWLDSTQYHYDEYLDA